ncbi:MAG: hypothetical protein ACI87W_000399 [Halieaceae bacterium]
MTEPRSQRYNLVFAGQLLPDTNRESALGTLAEFFGVADPSALGMFFSGRQVPLRRNLSKQDATRLYRQLRSSGLLCEVEAAPAAEEPAATEELAATAPAASESPPSQDPAPAPAVTPAMRATPVAASRRVDPGKEPSPAPARRARRPQTATAAAPVAGPIRRGKAPNLFALRPALDRPNPAALRAAAQLRAIIFAGATLALLVVPTAAIWRFPAAPQGEEPRGPLAATELPNGRLLLMVPGALLLHERSGLPRQEIAASELGLRRLQPPLWADRDGHIFLNGVAQESESETLVLYRCALDDAGCAPFFPDAFEATVLSISGSVLGDVLYMLDDSGQMLRVLSDGSVAKRAPILLPWGAPRLEANEGLLLLPAADGPLLGVYSPDAERFGQQLDALLLMPEPAVSAGQDRIQDFASTEQGHWSLLAGDTASRGLYRFDHQWNLLEEVSLDDESNPGYLLRWRDKLLLGDPDSLLMPRYASAGQREVPLRSEMLQQYRDNWLSATRQRTLLRTAGMTLPLFLALLCAITATLYLLLHRHLHLPRSHITALLNPVPAGVHWLPVDPKRSRQLLVSGTVLLSTAALPFFLLLIVNQPLRAFLLSPALLGSLYAAAALRRGCAGHLGFLADQVIAVDYDGRYYFGRQAAIRGNHQLLIVQGVAVPIGFNWLRHFPADAIAQESVPLPLSPRATPGELLALLWHAKHPWLHAALAFGGGWITVFALYAAWPA